MTLVHQATIRKQDKFVFGKEEKYRNSLTEEQSEKFVSVIGGTDETSDDFNQHRLSGGASGTGDSVSLHSTLQGYQLAVAREAFYEKF